jgi:hypothetical protein
MTTYYIDPTAASPGNGTLASPFKSWTSVTWAPGKYLFREGPRPTPASSSCL